jgi:hypothetical protein
VAAESKKLKNFSENPNFYDILVTGGQLMDFLASFWAISIRQISKTKENSNIWAKFSLFVAAESKKLKNLSENPYFYDIFVTGAQLMDFFLQVSGQFRLDKYQKQKKISKNGKCFHLFVPPESKNWKFFLKIPIFMTY